MAQVIEATAQNFDTLIAADHPVLVDFWAEWCGPCKMMNPIIQELAEELGDKVTICKVNVDEDADLSVRYGIRSIPTMMIFKSGEMVDKLVGATTKRDLAGRLAAKM
ncbi:thioredoxin [Hugenholtzia roseola]|uniref:thioredoxin n=1 Tax=Hugenholtzia roseola TaxID=1002 RepID=UPI0004283CEF|nr:thioredoxin [Hugenholtzia roseola]